jgi:hypothetical protein
MHRLSRACLGKMIQGEGVPLPTYKVCGGTITAAHRRATVFVLFSRLLINLILPHERSVPAVLACEKRRHSFLSAAFPMFVPSLSW